MLLSHAAFPAVKKLGDTDIAVDYGGFVLKIEQSTYAPDKVIAAMDKNGVDVSMISCNIPDVCILGDEWITEASRVTNDAIAETCDKYKGRFFGVASLPWRLTDDSIKELDRVKAMGFKAVHLHSHAGEMMVDDPAMLPIYRHCEKIDMPIVILFVCLSALYLVWAVGCFTSWLSKKWFKWFKIGLTCAAAASLIIEFIYHSDF